MIWDTFLFCHELDMLELRLRLLYDHVDKFVILECDTTHSGHPKPLHFEENKTRFDWAKDKIVHLIGKDFNPKHHGRDFAMEHAQREYLYRETLKLGSLDDIMLVSDVDEIPSREVIEKIKGGFKSPTVFRQEFYYYNINCPWSRKWTGTIALKFSDVIGSIETLRGQRADMLSIKEQCGWHFSYFFKPEDITIKLHSFAHAPQFQDPQYSQANYFFQHIVTKKSFVKDHERLNENPEPLPDYLLDELARFPLFMGTI